MSLNNFISGGIRTSEGMKDNFLVFTEFSDESVVQQSEITLGPDNESTVVAILVADTGPDNESATVAAADTSPSNILELIIPPPAAVAAAAALPCAAHSPLLPLANFSHPPFQPQRFPPPWALQ